MSAYAIGGQPPPQQQGEEQLEALQAIIQGLHELMTVMHDPTDTAVVSQCLTALTKVQKDLMVTRPQNTATQAVLSQLSGR